MSAVRVLGFVLVGLLLLTSATPSRAFVDSEVVEAAYAVAQFKATPRQEALVFMHNKDLNLMAMQGRIPPEVYQVNQNFFEMVNKGFVKDAAAQSGLVAKTQAPKPGSSDTFNPGTDTDIIVEKKPGAPDITEAQIVKTEKAYQDKVREYLKNSGVDPPDGKINTDTDFMPHPDHTTADEFTKINEGINKRGGTAYENPKAAKVEAQMRPTGGKGIPELDIADTGAYVTEMQNLANHKIDAAAKLEADAAAIRKSNPAGASKLDAEAQLLRSQASKYIDRIDKVTDIITKQNGLPQGRPKPNDSLTEAGAMIGQGRGTASKAGADVIGDVGTLAVNRGVKDYAETLSRLAAKDPSKAAAAQKQIAQQIKHMSPEMREQYVRKAKEAYTKSGGLDPEGFDKGLKRTVETTAKDFQAKQPAGGHDTPAKPGTPDAPTKPGTPDAPTKPVKPGTPDAPSKPGGPDVPGTKAKVINTVGTIMTIADIGNACETIEKYIAGEISGKEAAETLVDTTLTLGLIGAAKKVDESANTYWEMNKTIHQANKMNVVSYFTQWEIQLRKAGMSADEARRLVGQAMLSGDAGRLEAEAQRLRGEGKDVTIPTLVVDRIEYGLTDYGKEVLEQSWETGKGIVVGTYNGIKYIVLAPSRIVESWAQGELAEADLELKSAEQESWMKAKLFQRLLKAGVSPREALRKINDFFSGADMQSLRDLMKKLRPGNKGYLTSRHQQSDWYCTNRPVIDAPVALPPIISASEEKKP